jgi:hypothetical protein
VRWFLAKVQSQLVQILLRTFLLLLLHIVLHIFLLLLLLIIRSQAYSTVISSGLSRSTAIRIEATNPHVMSDECSDDFSDECSDEQ